MSISNDRYKKMLADVEARVAAWPPFERQHYILLPQEQMDQIRNFGFIRERPVVISDKTD